MNSTFEKFNSGKLSLPDSSKEFANIDWCHTAFDGVELKHIVTSSETDGKFSYHLVKIAPYKKIENHIHSNQLETHEVIDGSGICINDGKEIEYKSGIISVINPCTPHEVTADENGLYLFAKFIPAFC